MNDMTGDRLRAVSETLDILTTLTMPIAKALTDINKVDDEYVEVVIGFKRTSGMEAKELLDWLDSKVMQEDLLEWADSVDKYYELAKEVIAKIEEEE